MYSRHDLVWLTTDGWAAAAAQAHAGDRQALDRWRREDWPAVVRRRDADGAPGTLAAGIALPPDPTDGSKPRIALHLDASHVARRRAPLLLSEALAAAPAAWREPLGELLVHLNGLRLYGSLALQALTGMRYLGPASDVDLLFAPVRHAQLDAGLRVLHRYAARLPLDGELVFPSGDAVAWKEWRDACASGARVLVKAPDSVRLADPRELAATLASWR